MAFIHRDKRTGYYYLIDKKRVPAKWIKLGNISLAEAKRVHHRYETELTYMRLDMAGDLKMPLDELCAEFIADQKKIKIHKEHTIKTNEGFLKKICETFGSVPINKIDALKLEGWFAEKGYKPNSIRLMSIALKKTFDMAVAKKYLAQNPVLEIRRPKIERLPPKHVDLKIIDEVFAQMQPVTRRPFEILRYTGMRPSECLRLQVKDVDLKAKTVTVRHSKTKRFRVLPIHPKLLPVFKDLTKVGKAEAYLFPSENGHQTNIKSALNRALAKINKTRSEPIKFTVYQLRHTFLTEILNFTGDLRLAQQLAGHQSINTTTIYATALDERLRKAVNSL